MQGNDNDPQSSTPRWGRWLVRLLWVGLIVTIVGLFLLFSALSASDLPSFEDLENPKYDLASVVYDANGESIGKYYVENREAISYDELSPNVLAALLSTEDERFYRHTGIDIRALARVGVKSVILQQENSGGGSTITQQLAKLLFDRPNLRGMNSISRTFKLVGVKLKEWITAARLEKSYTKEEIIAMYLNKFEFINGAHGIHAAAETYFGKDQRDLNVSEAATLVGMLKNPSLYNPIRFPKKSFDRRNTVLNQMRKADHLDREVYDSLTVLPIDMSDFKRKQFSEGPAPYFRAELTKWLRNLFATNDIKKNDGSDYNIYTDGLKIYTTIDLRYQAHAEAAVKEHMQWNQERFWRVWNRKDPWTYDADDFQKAIRKDVLMQRVRSSDRYLSKRDKTIAPVIAELRESYPEMPFNDASIEVLQQIAVGESTMSAEVEAGNIDDRYAKRYQKLLKSEKWTELQKEWLNLQDYYDKAFNTEVSMKVFDHKMGERDTVMTPLDSVRYHNMHLQTGLLAVDPSTGYIKAWVGGIDHKYFKYDHVNSRRQVGSTIKPFVYATAISLQGISPCQSFDDIQYSIVPGDANFDLIDEWSPANANGEFTNNSYNLYHGLLYSKNSITVRLIKEMGTVEVLRDLLRNVGVDVDADVVGDLPAVPNLPSISLGAVNLPLMEMAGAYTTFANKGVYTEPIFVTHIEDKNGRVLYTGVPDRKVAINPLYNAVMVDMLRNNTAGRYGLGIKAQHGGKTGTTNDYGDAWFMGITPTLVAGTWVGGDDKWIRFLTLDEGQGYVTARPIVQKFLRKIEKDTSIDHDSSIKFADPPAGFIDLTDCGKFKEVSVEDEQAERQASRLDQDAFDTDFDTELDEELEEELDDELDDF